jgi:hypothetical protein
MATAILFVVLIVAALAVVPYAWIVGRRELRMLELPAWRRRWATVALIAATVQAGIFIALFTPLCENYDVSMACARVELILSLIAIPCALVAKGVSRWWVALSSVVLTMGSLASMPMY